MDEEKRDRVMEEVREFRAEHPDVSMRKAFGQLYGDQVQYGEFWRCWIAVGRESQPESEQPATLDERLEAVVERLERAAAKVEPVELELSVAEGSPLPEAGNNVAD